MFYGSSPNILKTIEFNTIYLACLIVSGVVLAGVVGWLLVRALAATGALNRFAAGRELVREV
jgi:energy-coupling factor transport system substrate-specific component